MNHYAKAHIPSVAINRWPGVSYYETELGDERIICPPPQRDQTHQIIIVGAGLAGLSTALSLTERGLTDIAVCDAQQPGHGASGRNGGFVFAGYSLPNQALTKQAGLAQGRELHQWTTEAVRLVRRRIDQFNIDCHANDAGVLLTDWFHDDARLKTFAQAMRRDLGFELGWIDAKTLSDWVNTHRYGSALYEPGSFHFYPLRYVNALVRQLQQRGVVVYGNTPIDAIDSSADNPQDLAVEWRVRSGDRLLRAEQVILTTGGYDTSLWPKVGRAIQPIATYIATTEPLGDEIDALIPKRHAIYDTRFAFDYYRPLADTRLLWGGRISIEARTPQAIQTVLKRDLMKVFPQLEHVKFDHAWGGWMGYTRHKMPLLGQDAKGLWHATGFGGHGMAPTTLAGEVMAEALSGEPERMQAFSRWQTVWAGGPIGRAFAQGTYWWLQAKDAIRDRAARYRGQRA